MLEPRKKEKREVKKIYLFKKWSCVTHRQNDVKLQMLEKKESEIFYWIVNKRKEKEKEKRGRGEIKRRKMMGYENVKERVRESVVLVEFDFKGGRESENQMGIGRWVRQIERPDPWYVAFTYHTGRDTWRFI